MATEPAQAEQAAQPQSAPAPETPLGPITLRPIFQERIWGVETLPPFYPQPAPGQRIGEAWLTAETCLTNSVQPGQTPDQTLADLAERHPTAFADRDHNGFPLLIKLLFPREKLSIQVHPNDLQAQAIGLPRGKTECWYILSAEPGAQIALGFRPDLKPDLTPDQLRAAIAEHTLEDKLRYLPVKDRDMVYVDAGTVHAIGPGMVVLETQQYSDVTYRLYDYGRPRELHLDAGVAVSRTSTAAGLVPPVPMDGFTRLVTSPYFVVDRFTLQDHSPAPLGEASRMQMLVALNKNCAVENPAGDSTPLPPGCVVLLPAEDLKYTLHGAGEVIRILQP